MTSNAWMDTWFSSQTARNGGIVRRARRDVDRFANMDWVIEEARQRRWHVIETGDQVVLLCHEGDLRMHC
jgi:phage baseplate assembly protein gpV